MAVDLSVFDKVKNFDDYNKLEQEFQLKKALAQQSVQTGAIDSASKANIFATQLLSGAVAGGQPAYDQARQKLSMMGIDTSGYAPDAETAYQQLQQARLAQSPLGALLNAGSKMDTNANSASVAAGVIPAGGGNAIVNNLLRNGALTGGIPINSPSLSIQAPSQPLAKSPMAPADQASALNDMYGTGNVAQPVVLQQNTAPPQQVSPQSSYTMPVKDPNETQAAYSQRLQNDPNFQANLETAKITASETAKAKVLKTDQGNASQELFDRLNKNLDALKDLAEKVPVQGLLLNPSQQAAINLRTGNGTASDALANWDQINKQQILNGLQQLVQAGAIRSNKTIVDMLNSGSGIPAEGTTVAGRKTMIESLRSEINNARVAAQNQAADLNGKAKQDYTAVPTVAVPNLFDKANSEFNARKIATPDEIAEYKRLKGIK